MIQDPDDTVVLQTGQQPRLGLVPLAPRQLAPLYILLRPLRLIRKYGRSHEAA